MTAPRTMDLVQPAHLPTGSNREKNCKKSSFSFGQQSKGTPRVSVTIYFVWFHITGTDAEA